MHRTTRQGGFDGQLNLERARVRSGRGHPAWVLWDVDEDGKVEAGRHADVRAAVLLDRDERLARFDAARDELRTSVGGELLAAGR